MNLDRGAVICDLAETYGIYDYRRLPPRTVAVLVSGLREDARIVRKISGAEDTPSVTDQLLAIIADRMVGAKGDKSLYNELTGRSKSRPEKMATKVFDSPEEFMKARYGGQL